MRIMLITLFFALLSISNFVIASESKIKNCDSKTTQKSQLRCLDQILSSLNRQRETWETNIEMTVSQIGQNKGDKGANAKVQKAKKIFDMTLKENCTWLYLVNLPSTNKGAIKTKKCEIHMIGQRIETLKKLTELAN